MVLDGDLRVAHALGEVLDLGPAAIQAAVIAGEKQIGMRVVADHVVVDPKPRGAGWLSLSKKFFGAGPGFRLGNVVGGAILRLLRLEDQVPLLVRA